MSQRTFGVEIECVGITQDAARAALVEAGLVANVEYYNHEVRSSWKITGDASVTGPDGSPGVEVISPILKGKSGLKALRAAATALEAAGATINRSCGLHVHVGARDLTLANVEAVVARYEAFEHMIDAFMPLSRRGNNNIFCHSMTNWKTSFGHYLTTAQSVTDLANRISTRYHKINVAAYLRHGTIEFRQHSGTVNAEKIENWVLFVLNFVEVSVAATARAPRRVRLSNATLAGRSPVGRVNDRARGLFKLVAAMRQGPCSTRTLAAVSGYSATSIPACMTEIRNRWFLRIKKSRLNGVYVLTMSDTRFVELERQFSTTPTPAAPPVRQYGPRAAFQVSPGDGPFSGLSTKLVSYFAERTSDLAV